MSHRQKDDVKLRKLNLTQWYLDNAKCPHRDKGVECKGAVDGCRHVRVKGIPTYDHIKGVLNEKTKSDLHKAKATAECLKKTKHDKNQKKKQVEQRELKPSEKSNTKFERNTMKSKRRKVFSHNSRKDEREKTSEKSQWKIVRAINRPRTPNFPRLDSWDPNTLMTRMTKEFNLDQDNFMYFKQNNDTDNSVAEQEKGEREETEKNSKSERKRKAASDRDEVIWVEITPRPKTAPKEWECTCKDPLCGGGGRKPPYVPAWRLTNYASKKK